MVAEDGSVVLLRHSELTLTHRRLSRVVCNEEEEEEVVFEPETQRTRRISEGCDTPNYAFRFIFLPPPYFFFIPPRFERETINDFGNVHNGSDIGLESQVIIESPAMKKLLVIWTIVSIGLILIFHFKRNPFVCM